MGANTDYGITSYTMCKILALNIGALFPDHAIYFKRVTPIMLGLLLEH